MKPFILLLVMVSLTQVQAMPIPDNTKVFYFPTSVGTKQVVQIGEIETTSSVKNVERDGYDFIVTMVTVSTTSKIDPSRSDYKFIVSSKGIWRVPESDPDDEEDMPKPFCILKLPFKAGEEWSHEDISGGVTCTYKFTSRCIEKIQTPAGAFPAIRVDNIITPKGDPIRKEVKESTWYAPGMGMIKFESGDVVCVLKSFSFKD
jgi:hypothetical protein